jgi:anti-sigma B factor antagonist
LATSEGVRPAEVPNHVDPGELSVEVVSTGGHHEVRLVGELDMSTAPQLRDALQDLAVGEAPTVTVDLGGLAFVDSTGLSVLIMGLKRCRQQGGDMALRSPTPGTLRVLEITGLTEVFTIG